MLPHNHVHGTGCSKCKRSRGETLIQNWLDKHNIKSETQKSFPDFMLPGCIKKTNRPKYDFYLPQQNILLEFDGKQHFEPVRFHGITREEANRLHDRTKFADLLKNEYAQANGFKLVRIDYKEIKQIGNILTRLLIS